MKNFLHTCAVILCSIPLGLYLIFIAICCLFVRNKQYEKDNKFYRFLLDSLTAWLLWYLGVKIHVEGRENVPKEQVVFSWITGNADMHLKNFSLYSKEQGKYLLTPAYDMLSTALVMPEDTEELALTLNGKKRKIKKVDFVTSMQASGLEEKVINNIFAKFTKAKDRWVEFIDLSFLPDEMKEVFKVIITERITLIC